MNNREKLLLIVSKKETKTVQHAKKRLATKDYRKISNLIAFEILDRLEHLGWMKNDLAEKMNVSPQKVNKWVKGRENFSLATLAKLSKIFGVQFISVVPCSDKSPSLDKEQQYWNLSSFGTRKNLTSFLDIGQKFS